jgi:hypothetical protein
MNQALYAHINNKTKIKKKTHNKNSFLVQLEKKKKKKAGVCHEEPVHRS